MLRIADLQNKSVLVTGASSGIGAAVARAFAQQGARVAVHWNTNSARELAAKNIRVNTVSPGVVDTPFHAATPPERLETMLKSICLGRVGTPDDCIVTFLFLASQQLSGYITGQNIHVNGGQVMP